MKRSAEGIIRAVDQQGRVVIPKEMRARYGIELGDPIEFFSENNTIMMRKYDPSCVFCGSEKNVTPFQGRLICANCLKALQKSVGGYKAKKK